MASKKKPLEDGGDALYAPPAATDSPPSVPAYPPTTPFQEVFTINKVGAFGFTIAVVIPSIAMGRLFSNQEWLSPPAWFLLSTLGAVLSGVLFVRRRAPAWVGAVGAALMAPGSLLAILLWTSGRQSVYRIELAIAFLLGALPGAGIYYVLFNRAVPRRPLPEP